MIGNSPSNKTPLYIDWSLPKLNSINSLVETKTVTKILFP